MVSTIVNLLSNEKLKWLFIGGKGGVGKTSISSAIAYSFLKKRKKVLLISTDPAHNLSDAFNQQLTSVPSLINGTENLYSMEIDVETISESFNFTGAEIIKSISDTIPGIDEIVSFINLVKFIGETDYDLLVFDTAPTGHTLRFLSMPKNLEMLTNKLKGMGDVLGIFSSMKTTILGGKPLPNDDLESVINNFSALATKVVSLIKNQEHTNFVSVCIPEFLSLFETERLIQELFNLEIDTKTIIINQVLYPELENFFINILAAKDLHALDEEPVEYTSSKNCSMCRIRSKQQQKYIQQIGILYEDFDIIKIPLLPFEIRGLPRIIKLSEILLSPFEDNTKN